jgi:hypothetical protein
MSFLGMTMIAWSSMSSHDRIDVRSAMDNIRSDRTNLMNVVFPYMSYDVKKSNEYEINACFDELDKLNKTSEDSSKEPNLV